MKKYYKWDKNGNRTEREPTEREKRDEVVPGYADLKKLSMGIVEKDGADRETEAEKRKAEVFTDRWKEFATGNDVKDKIDNILDLNNDVFEELRDALKGIIAKNPDFINQLRILLTPLIHSEQGIYEDGKRDKIERLCNRSGFYAFNYFLKQIDLINRANSGKLFQQQK